MSLATEVIKTPIRRETPMYPSSKTRSHIGFNENGDRNMNNYCRMDRKRRLLHNSLRDRQLFTDDYNQYRSHRRSRDFFESASLNKHMRLSPHSHLSTHHRYKPLKANNNLDRRSLSMKGKNGFTDYSRNSSNSHHHRTNGCVDLPSVKPSLFTCEVCLPSKPSFHSIEAYRDHTNSMGHILSLKKLSRSDCPSIDDLSPSNSCWRKLLLYTQTRNIQVDIRMHGGFVGVNNPSFMYDVCLTISNTNYTGIGQSFNEAREAASVNALSYLKSDKTLSNKKIEYRYDVENSDIMLVNTCKQLRFVLNKLRKLKQCPCKLKIREVVSLFTNAVHSAVMSREANKRICGVMPIGYAYRITQLGHRFECINTNCPMMKKSLDCSFDHMCLDENEFGHSNVPSNIEFAILCECMPTRGLIKSLLDALYKRLPNFDLFAPQLQQTDNSRRNHELISVYFIPICRENCSTDNPCDRCTDPDIDKVMVYLPSRNTGETNGQGREMPLRPAISIISHLKKFQVKIQSNKSALAALQILIYLFKVNNLLTMDNKSGLTYSQIEHLVEYWIVVDPMAKLENIIHRILHTLSICDVGLFQLGTWSISGANDNVTLPEKVRSLARKCCSLILDGRLIEAFLLDDDEDNHNVDNLKSDNTVQQI